MSKPVKNVFVFFLLICLSSSAYSNGVLSDFQRITSKNLGYTLQYKVYTPAGVTAEQKLPTLYVTDGQGYLEQGNIKTVLDNAIEKGLIRPLIAVFVDSRNPDNLLENRRLAEFMCNDKYARFYVGELMPAIFKSRPVSQLREDQVILGVSFGGLNSACFGLMLSNWFSGIAMQSPAGPEHVEVVRKLYEEKDKLPLKMYISVGTINDNLNEVKRFRRTLDKKGYDLTYRRVKRGHDWDNWAPLLEEVLIEFFPPQK